MPAEEKLRNPWFLAVWPGMGGVAISAGYDLTAKPGIHLRLGFPATGFFDFEQIEIKNGLILNKRLPRSRLFLWSDPKPKHDLIVFIGGVKLPVKGGAFCRKLIGQARQPHFPPPPVRPPPLSTDFTPKAYSWQPTDP